MKKLKKINWAIFSFVVVINLVGAMTNRQNAHHSLPQAIGLALLIGVPIGLGLGYLTKHD